MTRPAPARLPSAFTRFTKLLALRDRIAGLFRASHTEPRPVKLNVETMEERVVPDGRPLPFPVIFTGAGAGTPVVKAFDADTGDLRWSEQVYDSSFTGGVRVAAGDITGDGVPDAVVAPGAGLEPTLQVRDGLTGEPIDGPLGSFLAFGSSDTSGVFVASADVDGDGRQDVVAAALTASGPRVKVWSGTDGSVLASFLVSGSAFSSGITVAAADFTGDGMAEVVVGAGADGRVKIYDPLLGTVIAGPHGSFRAFGSSYTGGVFVAADELAGDIDGDSVPDLVVGTGPGATARVKAFSGADGSVLYNFQPFGSSFTGGARVALAFADDDEFADIVVGTGPGTTTEVQVFSGETGTQLSSPLGSYSPFGSSTDGVFVAASNDPLIPPNIAFTFNGSSGTPTLVAGESMTVAGTLSGGFTPTGTVTLALLDGSSATLGSWTLPLSGSGGTASFTPITIAMAAGSYSLNYSYSGDAHYASDTLSILSVTVASAAGPTPLALGGTGGVDPVPYR